MRFLILSVLIILGIILIIKGVSGIIKFLYRKVILKLNADIGYDQCLDIENGGYYSLTILNAFQLLKDGDFEIKLTSLIDNKEIKIAIPRIKVSFWFRGKIESSEYCSFFLEKGKYRIILENVDDLSILNTPFSLLSSFFGKENDNKSRTFIIMPTVVGFKKYLALIYFSLGAFMVVNSVFLLILK